MHPLLGFSGQQHQDYKTGPVALLLEHGVEFNRRRVLRRKLMRAKQCFRNAQKYAATHKRVRYVEGYALSIMPVEHAWCIDQDEDVIDPTWGDEYAITGEARPPADYFGIAFDTAFVRKMQERAITLGYKTLSILFSYFTWKETYPLVKEYIDTK